MIEFRLTGTMLVAIAAIVLLANRCAAQEWAKASLESSPRHMEYVTVTHGDRDVECFVAYPEVAEKAHAVVVIHDISGMGDWIRSVADQLAAAGYVAIVPDLLSGMAPDGGGTEAFASIDDARRAIPKLPPEQITADLTAAGQGPDEAVRCGIQGSAQQLCAHVEPDT